MHQAEKARLFGGLHQPGTPLVLYNIWDAGGARAIADAGAKAVATGSWSVAGAHGYADGQEIPMDLVLRVAARIAESVDVPASLDFEGAYAESPEEVAANVVRVMDTGIVGINFEDRIVGGEGLHATKAQCDRIRAMRAAADAAEIPFFINARTDVFLQEPDGSRHAGLMAEAKERGAAYAEAGGSGFFVPWLADPDLIATMCDASALPVNVMMKEGVPSIPELASLGVARVSYGPGPYLEAMTRLARSFREIESETE